KKKAKIIIGGKKNKKLNGAFYEPTLLTNINKSMKVWKEEVFGPVLPIVSFKTEDEAIKLANDTQFGLGCKIISKNINEAKRIASKIQAGTVEINGGVRWQYLNPFGGYKKSGMGRSYGIIGFREICQIKVISINK
ncbi:MAG: aldehyde dehydrogenase family protein, partial [Nanoarchaeota archaeon]|nr:aldehyde dehydrogenase family protein [Nanoarchaeota archaeon]